MIKSISTLLILFSTAIIYGQNITLLKNFNPKAKELKHSLNTTRDSLILESEKKILKVEIFNEDYEAATVVEADDIKISLSELPVGKFVVETQLSDKIIIMDLIKHEDYNESTNSNTSINKQNITDGHGMMLDERLNIIKTSPNNNIENLLNRGKAKKQNSKNQKFYWIIMKVNNESGSNKTMKLVGQESVNRMILKNKQEHKGTSGKLNELIVWEVYNTSKFMEHQVSNPNFVYSVTSEYFNTTPYYSTENNIQNI